MNLALRRSAAHVLVRDVEQPQLDDDAIHHTSRVLRLRPGESVTVTDGAGRWRSCVFTGEGVDASTEVTSERRPDPPLTIAVAPPKRERLEWLVAKCTEVGIDRFVLLDAEHSVVRWTGERAERQLARLRRVAVEASMQSRRVWLPEIAGPTRAIEVLPGLAVAEPGGRRVSGDDVAIAIGPEGGWSAKELEVAESAVSLGPNILRVETAAVAAAVLMASARQ
jgi:16S rRNA (uracil1498-N3)-methyltransferase